ncbi:hypothetical protein [Spirillospora sp. NPDC047279]|uniref:hypothetical protein n=1 Tax=Spirillospora sp. NPDC047279 TaxID=3155478 RepID=UPI0033D4D169
MDVPGPAPELVKAARTHLTRRFARGLDGVLWEESKRPMSDTDAVSQLLAAAARGEDLSGPDVAAALVVMQACQLDADRLEYELFTLAQAKGLGMEQIAAVLELPGPGHAEERMRYLQARHRLPVDPIAEPELGGASAHAQRAAEANMRADQADHRVRQIAQRRRELAERVHRASASDQAQRTEQHSVQARDQAEDATRHLVLAYLRLAEAHHRSAAALDAAAARADTHDNGHALELQRQADQHRAHAQQAQAQADKLA